MTFEGQYLSRNEYIALGGPTMDQTPFDLLEFEARKKIDENTFNRLKVLDITVIPQEVKLCEFKLINSIIGYSKSISDATSSGGVKSESTDGYSVSYNTASDIKDIIKSKNNELNEIITTYLLGVIVNDEHIMYRGID